VSRIKQARAYVMSGDASPEVRKQLVGVIKAARSERIARQQQGGDTQTSGETGTQTGDTGEQQAETPSDTGQAAEQPTQKQVPIATKVPDDVMAFVNDSRAAKDLSLDELRQRFQTGRGFLANKSLPKDVLRKIAATTKEARAEIAARKKAGQQGQGGNGTAGTDTTAGGTTQAGGTEIGIVEPAAELEAKAILKDTRPADKLSDQELRKRLQSIRLLLQANKISPATAKALRQKLAEDRRVLRGRVAGNQGGGNVTPDDNAQNGNVDVNADPQVKKSLADTRPSKALNEKELRLRIRIYRDAVDNKRYAEADRNRWRLILDQDRKFLRANMLDLRNQRKARLKAERDRGDLDINIGVVFQPDRPPPPPYVDAAEIDDQELEDVLIAPPRRQIDRRYSIEEVETIPELRDVMPRIEIDTVRFGFNESFVREEEVDHLDRIAEVIEKILAASPGEVFIIEGHTDAPGSEAYNLNLSRLRAQAVKEALTTFYVIPSENLKAVGYGERYLKIPTPEPEQENRRVSISRATPLVGNLED